EARRLGGARSMTILGHGALLVVANACLFAAGAGVTRAFGLWNGRRELLRVVGVSYLAGVAAFCVAAQFLYLAGLALPLWQSLLVCVLLAGTGLLPWGRQGRSWPQAPRLGRLELAAAAFAGLVLALLALDALVQPLASWDAWTQWTPKARALVAVGGHDPHIFGSSVYRHRH